MWSWVLALIGVTGIYFVGRKTIWGWFVLLFNECLWMVYAITTKQYGFIFASLAYAATYIKSYIHWSKEPVNDILHFSQPDLFKEDIDIFESQRDFE
jgi:nicotinamide riboside transporter PnuC